MKDIILLNNLFNGEYIKEKVGGEIVNIYQSDNGRYYIYVNPYGNIDKKWDDRIKYILFIRSVGNGVVKVIGKAEIDKQISHNAIRKTGKGIDAYQKQYIDENNVTYGNVKIYELGSWSNYFVTFEAEGIYKAKADIYLTTNENQHSSVNTYIVRNIKRINNQSQKLYIEPGSLNYKTLEEIIQNPNLWEREKVGKIDLSESNKSEESFLSIIRKENDELVNSNLLAYFLENDRKFWASFAENVLKISDKNVINSKPIITRESIGNIDLWIEVGGHLIVIENKIKSGINGRVQNGYSQLEKYVDVAKKEYKGDKEKISYYVLRPNYNNEDYKAFNKGALYKEIKYSMINDIIKDRDDADNKHFNEFKSVVKKHSAEYDNELFELVNDRFIEQIRNNQ
ncbi:MAG: PD-(D/E)XK nuclease family protein [Chitinophagales bacterium]